MACGLIARRLLRVLGVGCTWPPLCLPQISGPFQGQGVLCFRIVTYFSTINLCTTMLLYLLDSCLFVSLMRHWGAGCQSICPIKEVICRNTGVLCGEVDCTSFPRLKRGLMPGITGGPASCPCSLSFVTSTHSDWSQAVFGLAELSA